MHCTERETCNCHFPGNAFSKSMENRKKGQSTVNEQRPNRECALQTGPVTWTLGAKGVVLLLRLWLWISKINQQNKNKKEKRKKRKENAIKPKPHKKQQKLTVHYKHNNTSLDFQMGDLGQRVCSISPFIYLCFSVSFYLIKDYSSLSFSALFCSGPLSKLSVAHNYLPLSSLDLFFSASCVTVTLTPVVILFAQFKDCSKNIIVTVESVWNYSSASAAPARFIQWTQLFQWLAVFGDFKVGPLMPIHNRAAIIG